MINFFICFGGFVFGFFLGYSQGFWNAVEKMQKVKLRK